MLDIGPHNEPGGHAWLSIDGKRFGRSSKEPSKITGRMVHIGSSGIYEYWAMIPVTEIK